ncbi:acyl-CoA mutase large subunit family protein [Desulfoferrobacter suflitae]|uniref:acyl-CoA mutase large subunit family protein n=1 Tax=Desulfoferrobacter suflitae TaxID=2865782 RepID=UPI00216491EE|nr:methylmalonyl-CoA mutase family protein [Desulfoferrobacter suflitae]MCK8600863.1 methylmalonyl-CoA mutase family protein [Desulfoferrobacter suflitae]
MGKRQFSESALERMEKEYQEWQAEYRKALQKVPERLERFSTVSDLEVKPLYTPLDIKDKNYSEDIGFPGMYPFTRGVQSTMYRARHWTMRMFAGLGGAEDTNERFHYLINHGETGLSTAFDFPTLMGYDTESPLARGECGKCGVAIDTIDDMQRLFANINLEDVTTSMTINPPASVIWAMYIANAENEGYDRKRLGGTIQNDCLKEFIAQKTLMLPPDPSLRLVTDTVEFGTREVPRWNTISISGYHIREAGATAVQELAFTVYDGITYVEECLKRGLNVDDFAGRLSYFWNSHIDFFEEIAKMRAGRRMWARIMKERFKAKNPRSMLMRFHTQTAGCSLTAQEPYNNVVRTTTEALAAIFGGTQSLHTNSLDEVYMIPSEHAVLIALRTQQILAEEVGVTNVIDPLAGSYFVEALTDKMEEEATAYIRKLDEMGGMVAAIEKDYPQMEIADAAYHFQQQVEKGEKVIIGVNKYPSTRPELEFILRIDPELERRQVERTQQFKQKRDQVKFQRAMDELRRRCEGPPCWENNVMPALIDAVRAGATEQECCDLYRDVFGVYTDPGTF